MATDPQPRSNVPELSVSELAFSLKKTLEDTFGRVRVRGELSKVKIHTSGHLYSDLKDGDALINLVCWRASVARLTIRPEEGLEVICTGRITTYPARSNYQLVVEHMELAGQGALLKMLEDRRRRLAAEGLFDEARKKPLPRLPRVIGVVTSPTGAVIRDIIHRLDDRFPSHVIVWPVPVQGEGAADKIAAAIKGFASLPQGGPIPRPDILIVARGGGSLEDLMAFNEENVVRAVAACDIPLISAVGHETDTTLIDFAADRRAPTPTAAAEMAVPERLGLLSYVEDFTHRLSLNMRRKVRECSQSVMTLTARLGDPRRLLEMKSQKFDHLAERLPHGLRKEIEHKRSALLKTGAALRHPQYVIDQKRRDLSFTGQSLAKAAQRLTVEPQQTLARLAGLLSPALSREIQMKRTLLLEAGGRLRDPRHLIERKAQDLSHLSQGLNRAAQRLTLDPEQRLSQSAKLLDVLSFRNVVKRGYAVIRKEDGSIVTSKAQTSGGDRLLLDLADGVVTTRVE